MKNSPEGLTNLSTEELKKLLRLIYKNEVRFPLDAERIACIGFQYKHSVLINALRDLDATASRAVIVCVLAERLQR
jgi:hypothetical protein